MKNCFYRLLILSALTLGVTNVSADAARREPNPNDGMAQRLQQQLAAIKAENQQLAAEKQKLSQDKEATQRKLDAAQAKLSQLEGALGKFRETNATLTTRLEDSYQNRQEFTAKMQEIGQKVQSTQQEVAQAQQLTVKAEQERDACMGDKRAMYELNLDILKQYREKGVWDAFMQREPVTRLKQVEVENKINALTERIKDAMIPTATSSKVNVAGMAQGNSENSGNP